MPDIASGWYFEAKHVPEALNDAIDSISPWTRDSTATNLIALRPGVPWYEQVTRDRGRQSCSNIWDSSSPGDPSLDCLSVLSKDISGHSFATGAR